MYIVYIHTHIHLAYITIMYNDCIEYTLHPSKVLGKNYNNSKH